MRSIVGLGLLATAVFTLLACGPSARQNDVDADPHDNPCTDGANLCTGNTLETCQDGEYVVVSECPQACSPALGCVVCVPGTGTCNGDIATECMADGSGYHDVYCDPVQGMSCGASGVCEGACAPLTLGNTYYGCDYYPTVTGNLVDPFYDFAVAVSNTTATEASITIDSGALGAPDSFIVPAGSVVVRTLPWVQSLKLCSINCTGAPAVPTGALAVDGSYHLRSNVPVTVYQFNPLQYFKPGASANSYTNDASLLFPTNAWRGDHYVASFHQTGNVFPSEMAVTAMTDGTQVTITTTADSGGGGGAPPFVAGVPQIVTLNAGDVIEIIGNYTAGLGDLTGTHVVSDRPVQVIGGHFCAYVPDDGFGYCDHMEEVMLPVEAMGVNYVVNAPAVTTIPNGKEQVVRIIATQPNTTLTYDPPQAGAPTTIAGAGQFVEIARQAASYLITANSKILVAQLMEGSTAGGGTGDPAMALAVPVEQFRNQYLFHAPTNYETNYVDITAPPGATITLDGAPIPPLVPIGSSGWALSRVTPLGNGPANDGNHLITGDNGFGITVYGYGQDTSYWYPGGLDLSTIVVE
jgi:hypothetical protein